MAIRLNHTIVAANDKKTAAKFLTEILGLPTPLLVGPFAVVGVSDDTSLDSIDGDDEITSQHYAFLLDKQGCCGSFRFHVGEMRRKKGVELSAGD
jgi:hypothetical protein